MSNPLGGVRRGWPDNSQVYQRIFGGNARVGVEFYDYTLHEMPEMLVAVGRERGSLMRGDFKLLDLTIRTTRVFRRVDGRWRQLHHHGSFEDPKLLTRYQEAVL